MHNAQSGTTKANGIEAERSLIIENIDCYISKHHSLYLYGLAAIAMVYHHLFCIPDRLNGLWVPMPMLFGVNIELTIAWYCKLCVAIFAFLSGYGFVHYADRKWGNAINTKAVISFWFSRLRKFYPRFWFIATIFLTYGFLSRAISLSLANLITTALGISTQFNGEWWYIKQYLVLVALFPALYMLFQGTRDNRHLSLKLILSVIITYAVSRLLHAQFTYCLIFIEGIMVARYRIFDRVNLHFENTRHAGAIAIAIIMATFIIRTPLASEAASSFPDVIIIAPFIYSVISLLGSKKHRILASFGKHSTSLWLSHTFLIYYYFQPIILMPKYSVLIFFWALFLSLLVAILLDASYARLSAFISKIIFNDR